MNLRRWLAPGIGIKRWLLVTFAGLLVLSLAFAHFLRQLSRDLQPTGDLRPVVDELAALNGGATLEAGQTLVLPG